MRVKRKIKRNTSLKKNVFANPIAKVRYFSFILLPVAAVIVIVYFITAYAKSAFIVKGVVFSGNAHLTDEELKNLAGLNGDESMLSISSRGIFQKMGGSPWIKAVSVRKELPDRLHIVIKEAEPFALLDMKGRLFIVDEKGKMLEELKDSTIPFLPIISGNPFSEKEVYSEAIDLARAVKGAGLLSRKDHIEIIAHKPQELAVNMDGIVVKVGAGEYEGKLARLLELEDEIRNRHIPVDYIDLRFANRVIVKPVNEVIR